MWSKRKYLKSLSPSCAQLLYWRFFSANIETYLEADASGYAIGGVLPQIDKKNRLRPVGYLLRELALVEANYNIYDKELLAIITTIRHFDGELRSVENPFTVISDHQNEQYFTTSRQLSERQVRWAQTLARFHFKIVFWPGSQSAKPDFLSQRAQEAPQHTSDEQLQGRNIQSFMNKIGISSPQELILNTINVVNLPNVTIRESCIACV